MCGELALGRRQVFTVRGELALGRGHRFQVRGELALGEGGGVYSAW